MTFTLGDSSTPPGSYPPVGGWAFYLGGDTPHVWSAEEVAAIPAGMVKLPIWTRSNPGQVDPNQDAQAYVAQLMAYGVPKGVRVGLDFETAVYGAYVQTFNAVLRAAGYLVMLYGSQSTVTQNPQPDGGYWGAQWTGQGGVVAGDKATQWEDWGQWDESTCVDDGLWWGSPTPPPVPVPTEVEDDEMQQVEPLAIHPDAYCYVTVNKSKFRLAIDGFGQDATVRVVVFAGIDDLVYDNLVIVKGFHDIGIDPAHTSHVTVQRLDNGNFPIGVGSY